GETSYSVTSISGSLVVWSEPSGTKLFEVRSGEAYINGILDVQELTVSGTPVALEGHAYDERYYTKASLQASGQAQVHWGNLTNAPATATRWPRWSEVTNKPSSFVPSAHAASHAQGGSDPITPEMIGAQPALGYTPVNKAGDTITGLLKLYAPAQNQTVDVIRIGDRDNGYGFVLRYTGQEEGNNNALEIWADNVTGTPVRSLRITQDGVINVSGINVAGSKVWHEGNDGAGSGLDADLLDGQNGSFYRNASNLNAGTLPAARFNDTSHGQRGGGNLHAVATPTTAGFMSAEDKAKLDGIEAGAEVNQNAFSRVAVAGQSAVQATAKTDTLNLSAGANIQITTSASDKRVVISAAHDHRQQYAELPVAVDR